MEERSDDMTGKTRRASVKAFTDNREFLQNCFLALKALCLQGAGLQETSGHDTIDDATGSRMPGGAFPVGRFLQRMEATAAKPDNGIPLLEMAAQYNLGRDEQLLLAAVVGYTADPDLEELLGRLGSPRKVTVRALQRMLAACGVDFTSSRAHFTPGAPLIAAGLLRLPSSVETEDELQNAPVRVSRDFAAEVLGCRRPGSSQDRGPKKEPAAVRLSDLVLPESVLEALRQFVENPRALDDTLAAWGCTDMMTKTPCSIAAFWGEKGSGRRTAAEAVAGELGLPLVPVNPMDNAKGPDDSVKLVASGLEAAKRAGGVAMIHPADPLFLTDFQDELCPGILEALSRHEGRVILVTKCAPPPAHPISEACSVSIHFPRPDRDARERLWRKLMPAGVPLADEVDFAKLATAYPWNAGRIIAAIRGGVRRAAGRPGGMRVLRLSDLTFDEGPGTAGAQGSSIPSELLAPSVTLENVALPGDLMGKVREIVKAAEHRGLVLEKWGFGEKYRTGHGISALFYGPSGTGKTLTAEAIAGELGLPLRIVSAANILDKWVGETEKNTASLFRASSEAGEVLLLDEADGLFSRRVSNSSNNSYYINNHINCLLAEMDSFKGVVLLSSNRAFAMDRAFDRRIRWKLRFPLPDAEARELIWRLSLPVGAPLEPGVDFAWLAQRFEHSGGLIRSAVLKAAYAAAAEGSSIGMRHLVAAAESEEGPHRSRGRIGFMHAQGESAEEPSGIASARQIL